MAPVVRIQDIDRYVGQEVTLQGWLYNRTDKGKLQFLQVPRRHGLYPVRRLSEGRSRSVFAAAARLTQESSLVVTGVVRQTHAPGCPRRL